jgi:hypothetical protein
VNKTKRPLRGQDPEVVATAIVKAVRRKKKEVHLTLPGKLLLLIDRVSNSLASRIVVLAAKVDRQRH